MAIRITSKTLSDYDAQRAFNTATAYLRTSDLALYLIKNLEHSKKVTLNVEVCADPSPANADTCDAGNLVWNLHGAALAGQPEVIANASAEQQAYLASQWRLMHLLAQACEQLNADLNFRDADATWPWLDEDTLSARDIETAVARELNTQPLPDGQSWDRVFKA